MIAKTLVVAALAATVTAGPCKPKSLPSDIFSISIESMTESTTPVETTTSGQTTAKSETGLTTESTDLDSITITSSEQSTKTTEAASTTTTSGPSGEAIFLQVNPQRRLAKRDTTFVGNNNPTSCTFATVFHIESEQILQGGVPIYYEGGGYQEFAAQGTPPADAITRAFSITGGDLSWANPAFGEAGFCQTPSDGKVYITFSSKPTDCQSVTLTAYKESQCQNGHIVGLETSSAEVTSAAESTSVGVTTSADGASSAETTTSKQTTSEETTSEETTFEETTSRETTSADDQTSAETTSKETTSGKETSSIEVTKTTEETTFAETTSNSAGVTSSVDACVEGLRNPNGQPDVQSRIHDCSVYNTVTVSPLTSTATLVKRRVLYQMPTAWATPQPMIRRRADDPTDTTIFPTSVPPYATYCDSPSEYYEACSEAGVTAFTTTLPEPETTTTTSTKDICAPKSKFKRAVEYLGYTMSEDWDRDPFATSHEIAANILSRPVYHQLVDVALLTDECEVSSALEDSGNLSVNVSLGTAMPHSLHFLGDDTASEFVKKGISIASGARDIDRFKRASKMFQAVQIDAVVFALMNK
ncbi:hypothetical protein FSARC_14795 [Fusarium sarcochroum]|uniref:DUF7908 domain-containing protein n=1 Tax=Fusarium sarcochroum TaxID=1208366 RepID=A0A8H4SQM9_9HYPO|nr:hypothetical protein FSARC_14795 [Fusarium sarcochroum]